MQVLILVFSFQLSKYTIWDADPLCIGAKYLSPNYQRFVSQAAQNVFYQLHRRQKCFLPSPTKISSRFPHPSTFSWLHAGHMWTLTTGVFTIYNVFLLFLSYTQNNGKNKKPRQIDLLVLKKSVEFPRVWHLFGQFELNLSLINSRITKPPQ